MLSFAGMASLIGFSERLEPLFLLWSAAMGVVALIPAYRKKHGRVSCLAMFASGFLCLILRRYIGWQGVFAESVPVAVGAFLIVGAHLLNLRFSRRCVAANRVPREATLSSSKPSKSDLSRRQTRSFPPQYAAARSAFR